jgi:hypothetical protein
MSGGVEFLIRKVSGIHWNAPEHAPSKYEVQNSKDINGNWDFENQFDYEDLQTEIISEEDMYAQHKPSLEVVNSIREFLGRFDQHLLKIDWKLPDEVIYINREGSMVWAVISAPNDSTDLPKKIHWSFWEVEPGDVGYDFGISITDSDTTRIYGE